MKLSLAWLRITTGRKVVSREQWETTLDRMRQELSSPDYDDDGFISVGELVRFAGSVVITVLKSLKQVP